MHKFALGQGIGLENIIDGLQIKLFGQVQNRQVFVIKFKVLVGLITITCDQIFKVFLMRLLVAILVHRHKAIKLDKAWIDPAHHAGIGRRDRIDHIGPKPGKGALLSQLIGHSG